MGVKKLGGTYAVALVVGLYTTLVVQSLWNWFAVKALNAPRVSYWEMYGLKTMLSLLLVSNGRNSRESAASHYASNLVPLPRIHLKRTMTPPGRSTSEARHHASPAHRQLPASRGTRPATPTTRATPSVGSARTVLEVSHAQVRRRVPHLHSVD
jgi:hypothetical protein